MSRQTRATMPLALRDTSQWFPLLLEGLSDAKRSQVLVRQAVLTEYLRGGPVDACIRDAKYSREQLLRDLNRCLAVYPDGSMAGWRGLSCAMRRPYRRKKSESISLGSRGKVGMLAQFFAANPDIKDRLDSYILTRKRDKGAPDRFVQYVAAHGYFIRMAHHVDPCKERWPFTTATQARSTIDRYVKTMLDRFYDVIVESQYGSIAQAKAATGRGIPSIIQFSRPYDCVEMDEHTLDCISAIGLDTPEGIVWTPVERVDVIALADRTSKGSILGFLVVITTVGSDQILRAVHLGVTPWKSRSTEFVRLPDAGFPSEEIEELAGLGFAVLMVDNAHSHLAYEVADRIMDTVGCVINFGKPRDFERRATIEGAFKRLEERGFKRVVSSTGGSETPKRRADPAAQAKKYRVTLVDICDLVQEALAECNGVVADGLFGQTRNAWLRRVATDQHIGFIPPRMPLQSNTGVSLNIKIRKARVCGSRQSGERPYINYSGARYRNPELSTRHDLIDKYVFLHIDVDDISVVDAFVEGTAQPLGSLDAQHQWNGWPHSLEARQTIRRAISEGRINLLSYEPVQEQYQRMLGERALRETKRRKGGAISRSATEIAAEQLRHSASSSAAPKNRVQAEAAPSSEVQPSSNPWPPDLIAEEDDTPLFIAGETA